MKKSHICSVCNKRKLLRYFELMPQHSWGTNSQCKQCRHKYYKKRYYSLTKKEYKLHKEKSRIAMRKFRLKKLSTTLTMKVE